MGPFTRCFGRGFNSMGMLAPESVNLELCWCYRCHRMTVIWPKSNRAISQVGTPNPIVHSPCWVGARVDCFSPFWDRSVRISGLFKINFFKKYILGNIDIICDFSNYNIVTCQFSTLTQNNFPIKFMVTLFQARSVYYVRLSRELENF